MAHLRKTVQGFFKVIKCRCKVSRVHFFKHSLKEYGMISAFFILKFEKNLDYNEARPSINFYC